MISNSLFVEQNVPTSVIERTYGFFNDIGWVTRPHSSEPDSVYVHPLPRGEGPVIAYWHTDSPHKLGRFTVNGSPTPSRYSQGLWHATMQETTEVVMIVPDAETVEEIAHRGGDLLAAHTHKLLRVHAGALEFRFTDHVNNAIRITHFDAFEM